jgi:hypothetical protein
MLIFQFIFDSLQYHYDHSLFILVAFNFTHHGFLIIINTFSKIDASRELQYFFNLRSNLINLLML